MNKSFRSLSFNPEEYNEVELDQVTVDLELLRPLRDSRLMSLTDEQRKVYNKIKTSDSEKLFFLMLQGEPVKLIY